MPSSDTNEGPFVGYSFMVQEDIIIIHLCHKCLMITMVFVEKDEILDLRISLPSEVMVGKI